MRVLVTAAALRNGLLDGLLASISKSKMMKNNQGVFKRAAESQCAFGR